HGWNGSPSLNPAPALPPATSGGRPGAEPFGSAPSYLIQMPEKSGLPSAVRGAGAARLGLPSAPLGTPGNGYNGHCANSNGDRFARMAVNTATVNHRFMSTSRFP